MAGIEEGRMQQPTCEKKHHCLNRRYEYAIQQSNKKATTINIKYRRSLWRTSILKLSVDEYFSMVNTQSFLCLNSERCSLKKTQGHQFTNQWMSAEVINMHYQVILLYNAI